MGFLGARAGAGELRRSECTEGESNPQCPRRDAWLSTRGVCHFTIRAGRAPRGREARAPRCAVERRGIEPRLPVCKTGVFPLDDRPEQRRSARPSRRRRRPERAEEIGRFERHAFLGHASLSGGAPRRRGFDLRSTIELPFLRKAEGSHPSRAAAAPLSRRARPYGRFTFHRAIPIEIVAERAPARAARREPRRARPPTRAHAAASCVRKPFTYSTHGAGTSRGSNRGSVNGSVFGAYGLRRSFMPACSGVRPALRELHG